MRGEGALLRKSALQQYPVIVVQYAEADWGAAVETAEQQSPPVTKVTREKKPEETCAKRAGVSESLAVRNAAVPCAGQA